MTAHCDGGKNNAASPKYGHADPEEASAIVLQELYGVIAYQERGTGALRRALERWLASASWRQVAAPLLPLLPEADLLRALTHALPDAPAGVHQ